MNELTGFKEYGVVKKHAPGEYIYKLGESGSDIYILIRGSIELKYSDASTLKKVMLKSGEYFGENCLLEGNTRDDTAIAREETYLLVINRNHIEEFIADQPGMAKKIMLGMLSKYSSLSQIASSLEPVDKDHLNIINKPQDLTYESILKSFTTLWKKRGRDLEEIESVGFVFMPEENKCLWACQTKTSLEKGYL